MTTLDLGDRRKDLLNDRDRQEHQWNNLKNDVNCQTTRQKILQRIHHFLLNIRSSHCDQSDSGISEHEIKTLLEL